VDIIFSIKESDQGGYFIERGACIREGVIGLYFGLITEKQLPKSISILSSGLIRRNVPCKEYEDGRKHWYFPNHESIVKHTFDSYLQKNNQNPKYIVNQVIQQDPSSNSPQSISVNKPAELLMGKKVLIFTGAGISVSSGVPDMFQLEQLINEAFNPMNDYVFELVENKTENRLTQAKKLHGLFVYSEPSTSHLRIADLCNLYSYDLITGNLDGLHEKTGVIPQHYTEEKQVVDNLGGYEVLLTIGLGDEGNINLTEKYRNANPLGIAINKERPHYLGSNDYLIAGDSDEILEKLYNQLNDSRLK